jgi:beta-lactamase superfamily II metal-dependent hydrolase
MKRAALTALLIFTLLGPPSAAGMLEIYFIDVEGGQATLMVTPARESLLVDAGYGGRFGPRDAERIMVAVRDARLNGIDYLLITHFHPDHAGGVPELAARVPIRTFIDYGEPLGFDRMATGTFRNYLPVRQKGRHIRPQPGERLPLVGVDARIVSVGGDLISQPLDGGGRSNDACIDVEDHVEDGTENFRSLGVMFEFGRFRFLNPGDLSGNTLTSLACPRDLLGPVDAYLIAHHGDYDTSVPALYAAIRPRVAIMNNGVTKGGAREAFRASRTSPGLEDLWQLHASRNDGAQNAPDPFVANIADDGSTAHWIKLSAFEDGGFRIVNGRTGFGKTYTPPGDESPR